MAHETYKTNQIRGEEFLNTYFNGKVIDIGAGKDPVVASARVFDLEDGDAQYISKYVETQSYDCVNSSHCLEHMVDVPSALAEWWSLVKEGGYMVITVPHEDLYEQRVWPPVFNPDHKATFRLKQKESWSNVSYDIHDLCSELPNALIIDECIHDQGYDYSLQYKPFTKGFIKIWRWQFSKNSVKAYLGKKLYQLLYTQYYKNSNNQEGIPIDQTGGDALAQIQLVLQKKA